MDEKFYQEQEEKNWEEILLAITLLFGLSNKIVGKVKDDIRLWYSKYGVKGAITYLESRKIIPKLKISKKKYIIQKLNKHAESYINEQRVAFRNLAKKLGLDLTDEELFNWKWAVDNKSLNDRLVADELALKAKMEQLVMKHTVKGSEVNELLEEVDKVYKTFNKRASTRLKTEGVALVSRSQKEELKKAGAKKYIYRAVMDDRTSEICKYMNGRIFYVSEFKVGVNAPPLHPNCRSYTVPYNGVGDVGTKI